MKRLKVLIADDHRLFSDGLCSVLKEHPDIEICGTAANGAQVLEFLQRNSCDIGVLDINMPVMNGIETAKQLRQKHPEVKVIILTTYNDKEFINEMLSVGVAGYIMKNASSHELTEAILRVGSGKTWFSGEIHTSILEDYMRGVKKEKQATEQGDNVHLTQRETEIVKLLAKEYTNEKIASVLHISYRTVETHRKNIMQKTKAQNLAGLIRFAYEKGIIS
jgi:DNA-binding NarL/FixJ family response regulator